MSTDYGVYCLDCKESYIIDDMRNPEDVRKIIKNSGILAKLISTFTEIDFSYSEIEFTICGHHIDLSWFEKHDENHKVVVIDEYGARWPSCEKKYKSEKHNERFCSLEQYHAGECSREGIFEH